MRTYGNNTVIPKYSQKDINNFAKKLYKSNLIMWAAIHTASELMNGTIVDDFYNDEDLMYKLAKAYKKECCKKGDEGFADMGLHGADFQDFDCFTSDLQEIISDLDD